MTFRAQFTLRHVDPPITVGPETLERFGSVIGLDKIATDRYSSLLVLQVMVYAQAYGVDPCRIVDEIKALEGLSVRPATQTKPGAPFRPDGALAGLQHKHFTSSTISMVASNILAVRGKKALTQLAVEELGSGFSGEALARFVERVAVDGYADRADAGKLTGEWIVYIEHEGRNYYLCLATHKGGDDEVLGYIRNVCHLEFPFLKARLPAVFVREASNAG